MLGAIRSRRELGEGTRVGVDCVFGGILRRGVSVDKLAKPLLGEAWAGEMSSGVGCTEPRVGSVVGSKVVLVVAAGIGADPLL